MKYIISEEQNDRIKEIIKSVAETFTNEFIVKTEVEVQEARGMRNELYYEVFPIFTIKGALGPDFHLFRHQLAQYVEDYVGVPVHGRAAKIKLDDV
jgi:hypothetical protein